MKNENKSKDRYISWYYPRYWDMVAWYKYIIVHWWNFYYVKQGQNVRPTAGWEERTGPMVHISILFSLCFPSWEWRGLTPSPVTNWMTFEQGEISMGTAGPHNTHAKVGLIIINLYSLTIILMGFSRITVQWWRNCYLFNHFQIPAVRDFIHGALLEFERADFRKVPGKAPTAYFYARYGNILE